MSEARAAMILCAGLGTRLRPLTDEVAKPMVPIGDRPAVAHVVERVHLARPGRIVVNVHHRPDDLANWAEGAEIAVSFERELLGTAGGVRRAEAMLGDGDVLVWNGDILSTLDAGTLFDAHRAGASLLAGMVSEATLAVRERRAGEGNVGFAVDGRVMRLRTETFGEEAYGGDFLGIHVLGTRLRTMLPETGCLVGDVYLPSLRRGERLGVHRVADAFIDVGTLEAYGAANRAWLGARGESSWTAPDALVEASVDGSIVGRGARVDAPAIRSIVWPGAHVRQAVENAVVTRRGIVPLGSAAA